MLTADQKQTLRDAAQSNPACAEALAARDIDALVPILSAGRTRPSALEIGNGTILETIGIASGNTLLDFITGNPDLRHVRPLLEQGRLKIGSPVAQSAIRGFADANLITQEEADKLCALGLEPDPLTRDQVYEALFKLDEAGN